MQRLIEADGVGVGHGRAISVQLSWDAADPLAVLLEVEARPAHPSLPRGSWVVLRDFLRYGLEEPTGDGDVRIDPDPGGPESTRVGLVLKRAGRCCELSLPVAAIRQFLDETESIVPAGEEAAEAELDALIRRVPER